jgi:hypothetical protein
VGLFILDSQGTNEGCREGCEQALNGKFVKCGVRHKCGLSLPPDSSIAIIAALTGGRLISNDRLRITGELVNLNRTPQKR